MGNANGHRRHANPGSQTRPPATANSAPSDRNRMNSGESQQSRVKGSRDRTKTRVEGKRKVWGTLRTTTASAVSNAIKSVAKIEGLNVRRKYTRGSHIYNGRRSESRWWFIITGEESLLEQLSTKWSVVKLQTNWSLEPVLVYTDPEVSQQPSAPIMPQPQEAQVNAPTELNNTTPCQPHNQEKVKSDAINPCCTLL